MRDIIPARFSMPAPPKDSSNRWLQMRDRQRAPPADVKRPIAKTTGLRKVHIRGEGFFLFGVEGLTPSDIARPAQGFVVTLQGRKAV